LLASTRRIRARLPPYSQVPGPSAEGGGASGASQRLGSPSEEVTVYSENRESTSVPLEYKDSHILVIKYLD